MVNLMGLPRPIRQWRTEGSPEIRVGDQTGEGFCRRSFVIVALLVVALVIGVLETLGPERNLPSAEDRAIILAQAELPSGPIWAVVCAERDSAVSESERLASFIEEHDDSPTPQEGIVDGCNWAVFTVHFPLLDSDLPTMLNPGPDHLEVRWYHGNMTFKNGLRAGETLKDAYIMLDFYAAQILQQRPKNP